MSQFLNVVLECCSEIVFVDVDGREEDDELQKTSDIEGAGFYAKNFRESNTGTKEDLAAHQNVDLKKTQSDRKHCGQTGRS